MDLNNYYLHAVHSNSDSTFDDKIILTSLVQVLKSKKILSKRKMKDLSLKKGGWNGLDYISICDYSKRNAPTFENREYYKGYNAYELFIKNSIAFILEKEGIEGITPTLMPPAVFDYDSLEEMRILGNHPTKRFSDLPDEIQVKDEISLDQMIGMTIPIEKMMEMYSKEEIISFLKRVKYLLRKYHRPQELYDLESQILLIEEKDVEKAIEYCKVKKKFSK